MTRPSIHYRLKNFYRLTSDNVKYLRRKRNVYFISCHLLEERLYSNP